MKYQAVLAVAGLVALMACDEDPVEPVEEGPYELTTLRTLPEGTEAGFGDLNENGQALWRENGQAILWDNGTLQEVPVGEFLGDNGEILGSIGGTAAYWTSDELTTLVGSPRGITVDGTVYVARNDTLFTWRGGVLEVTDRPDGLVGPEGRIWTSHTAFDESINAWVTECGFYLYGAWHVRAGAGGCSPRLPEENGWAIVSIFGYTVPRDVVVGPEGYEVWSGEHGASEPGDIIHINSHGTSLVSLEGRALVVTAPGDERLDLSAIQPGVLLGAINDDGEILAQLDNEIVLLTPR